MTRIANLQPGLSAIGYHMPQLAEMGSLTLVGKRQVRGASEYYYFLRCPTITAAQQDALRDQVLDRLSGVGDIELAVRSGDYSTAKRVGREYSDDLLLLLNDLELGRKDGDGDDEDQGKKPVSLTTPPEVLRRVLPRLQESAEGHSASYDPELSEIQEIRERDQLVSEACEAVMCSLKEIGTVG